MFTKRSGTVFAMLVGGYVVSGILLFIWPSVPLFAIFFAFALGGMFMCFWPMVLLVHEYIHAEPQEQ